jgi:hypothetical protein
MRGCAIPFSIPTSGAGCSLFTAPVASSLSKRPEPMKDGPAVNGTPWAATRNPSGSDTMLTGWTSSVANLFEPAPERMTSMPRPV